MKCLLFHSIRTVDCTQFFDFDHFTMLNVKTFPSPMMNANLECSRNCVVVLMSTLPEFGPLTVLSIDAQRISTCELRSKLPKNTMNFLIAE